MGASRTVRVPSGPKMFARWSKGQQALPGGVDPWPRGFGLRGNHLRRLEMLTCGFSSVTFVRCPRLAFRSFSFTFVRTRSSSHKSPDDAMAPTKRASTAHAKKASSSSNFTLTRNYFTASKRKLKPVGQESPEHLKNAAAKLRRALSNSQVKVGGPSPTGKKSSASVVRVGYGGSQVIELDSDSQESLKSINKEWDLDNPKWRALHKQVIVENGGKAPSDSPSHYSWSLLVETASQSTRATRQSSTTSSDPLT